MIAQTDKQHAQSKHTPSFSSAVVLRFRSLTKRFSDNARSTSFSVQPCVYAPSPLLTKPDDEPFDESNAKQPSGSIDPCRARRERSGGRRVDFIGILLPLSPFAVLVATDLALLIVQLTVHIASDSKMSSQPAQTAAGGKPLIHILGAGQSMRWLAPRKAESYLSLCTAQV